MDPREPFEAESESSVSAPLSAEDSSQPTPSEVASAKRELRKILREDSNWSIRSIAITALTGVSVAVIATQLNGLVSSFVLIAVMAFITASVSEIYRVFLALTGFGAKRAAAKAARVIPLLPAEQRATARSELSERIDGDSETREDKNPITDALHVVTDAYRLNPEQEAGGPNGLQRFLYRLRNYGRANPFLWLVVLFLGIALTTVSVAYLVTDGEPPRIIQRTVVQTEEIPEEDRAAIVNEAKDRALDELDTQQPTADPTTPAPSPTVDQATLDELTAISDRLTAMETDMATLQAPAAVPTPSSDQDMESLRQRLSGLETERDELRLRVDELEESLSALEQSSEGSSNGVSSSTVPIPR